MAAARHAVYFAPAAEHPLWQAGCRWLGRDARAGQPSSPSPSAERQAPWRYGFHATLKAPMAFASAKRKADWLDEVAAFAGRQRAFAIPRLCVTMLDDFVALCPIAPPRAGEPLRHLADACVTGLDAARAPLSPQERARRLRPGLSERQRRQVERWGYPHVLDDWRFHMTLTGPLKPASAERSRAEAAACFGAALEAPLVCDALCVFEEASPGAPFFLTHRFAFGSR